MANITDKEILLILSLFIIDGKVINYSDEEFYSRFKEIVKIDLKKSKYSTKINSIADRLSCFIGKETDYLVYLILNDLLTKFDDEVLNSNIKPTSSIEAKYKKVLKLSDKIGANSSMISNSLLQNAVMNNIYNLHQELYECIIDYLYDENYQDALLKAIKFVENKVHQLQNIDSLKSLCNHRNMTKILKHPPIDIMEKNFNNGMLHLFNTLLHFRNYLTHSQGEKIDNKLSMHYIYLSSLVCYYIDEELVS